jgi:hypothetical protein
VPPTFASTGQVAIVEATHSFVDLYKVGRVNYLPMTKTTDWREYTLRMLDTLNGVDARHYIKKDLQPFLPPGYPNVHNIPSVIKFISYEPALRPLHLPTHEPLPDWVISGGESGPRARPMDPQWVRDIIWQRGIAPFHKQWGTYRSNPLVVEQGMTVKDAKALDNHGKGGGLVDGKLIREFPLRIR